MVRFVDAQAQVENFHKTLLNMVGYALRWIVLVSDLKVQSVASLSAVATRQVAPIVDSSTNSYTLKKIFVQFNPIGAQNPHKGLRP